MDDSPLIPSGFFSEEDDVTAAAFRINGKCYVVCMSI